MKYTSRKDWANLNLINQLIIKILEYTKRKWISVSVCKSRYKPCDFFFSNKKLYGWYIKLNLQSMQHLFKLELKSSENFDKYSSSTQHCFLSSGFRMAWQCQQQYFQWSWTKREHVKKKQTSLLHIQILKIWQIKYLHVNH